MYTVYCREVDLEFQSCPCACAGFTETISKAELQKEKRQQRSSLHDSFPKCPQNSQGKASASWEPGTRAVIHCFPKCLSKELDQESSNWHSSVGCWCYRERLNLLCHSAGPFFFFSCFVFFLFLLRLLRFVCLGFFVFLASSEVLAFELSFPEASACEVLRISVSWPLSPCPSSYRDSVYRQHPSLVEHKAHQGAPAHT